MAADHRFTAFCSALLNSQTARSQFNNPLKQKELFAKYELTPAQIKAVRSKNIDAITLEFKKELTSAVRKFPPIVAIGW